jgi:hypothetical protein
MMINHHLNVAEEELKQHETQKAGRNQRQYQVLFQSKHVDMMLLTTFYHSLKNHHLRCTTCQATRKSPTKDNICTSKKVFQPQIGHSNPQFLAEDAMASLGFI